MSNPKQAYQAYGSVTNWKNYRGDPMPVFEALPVKIQEAWGAFTKKVLEGGGSVEEGYSAYGDTVEWKNFEGKPIPRYGQAPMTETIQKAWETAAKFLQTCRKDPQGLSCSKNMSIIAPHGYDRYEGISESEEELPAPPQKEEEEAPFIEEEVLF